MNRIYRTAARPVDGTDTLVLHCSDPRFQAHFQEFLRDRLGIERYALVAVPGGAHFLTLVDYLPKFAWSGWRWLKFLVDLAKPRRVILIAHDDCRWYIEGRFLQRGNARERLVADLHQVRRALGERFPAVTVETYFARLDDGVGVFEEV